MHQQRTYRLKLGSTSALAEVIERMHAHRLNPQPVEPRRRVPLTEVLESAGTRRDELSGLTWAARDV